MCKRIMLSVILIVLITSACTSSQPSPTPTPTRSRPWKEAEIKFSFGSDTLHGIVTLPENPGPHPAIVIISGSVDTSTGVRSGASSQYFTDHARKLATIGFASLRYDPPGVGKSTGQSAFEPLELRREEAIAALKYLQSRTDISPDQVGLWGISQGGWVIAMAASAYPQDVAFIISVSGSGVSVAEQQVYSIEAQSKGANFSEADILKASLFGRLLVDWQLSEPIYKDANQADAQMLGDGPWVDFMALVYDPGEIAPADSLQGGIEILKSIKDEPWAKYLYLEELYLPTLERIPPEYAEELRSSTGENLLNDPQAYMKTIYSPVLAFFGENDLLQPSEKSAALYEQYLAEAGNQSYKIVIIPGAGHSISLATPGYWEALSEWLTKLEYK